MKKGLIISLSVLAGVIVLIVTLCFTVFTVKTVEIDYRTSLSKQYSEEEIIDSSGISYGKCLLFLSKKGFQENIEKEFPKLEVINIEKVFPSKLVIHLAEREAIFAVQSGEETVFFDRELKVLEIQQEPFESDKNNPIILKGLENTEFKEGQFLDTKYSAIKKFYASMIENNKTLPQVLGFCKQIELLQKKNALSARVETNMIITTFAGREIKILNIDKELSRKLSRMFNALPRLYELLLEEGDYSVEEVNRCNLLIGNQITDETELYVHIYLDGVVLSELNRE